MANAIRHYLNDLLSYLELDAEGLAEKIGLERADRIRNVLNGRNGVSDRLAKEIIATYRNISYSWLLTGEGEMLKEGESNLNDMPNRAKITDNPNQAIVSISESNRILAEASKTEAEAIKKIAEANYDLVQMLKQREVTVPGPSLSDVEKYLAAKELKRLLDAKTYPNVEAVVEEWNKLSVQAK